MQLFKVFELQWIGCHMNTKLWKSGEVRFCFVRKKKIKFSILGLHNKIYVISGLA